MENAAPLEIAWSVIALVAMCAHIYAATDAGRDVRALRHSGRNGLMLYQARVQAIRLTALTVVQFLILSIGVRALFVPSLTPIGESESGAILSVVSLILAEVLLAGIAVSGVWTRHRIRRAP